MATIGFLGVTALSTGEPAQAQMPGALEECLGLAGIPSAAAPVSRDATVAVFSALAKARPHCEAALIGPEQNPEVMFHMAVIMQREGFHQYAAILFPGLPLWANEGFAELFEKGVVIDGDIDSKAEIVGCGRTSGPG